ncbi:hypothetical protein OVN18_12255 [Microcella daejeonensis]|uniref:Vitamin K epoxide reductase family protein n=1 Tax=Microcella daejeonensis TaxID=2994971 RepID=A0A9E8MKK5_9MICO|nr:hypothetical protein [Microcella daejeonensis]WAB81294.1 hypothetical protein OVN18_12255 [Microcella daejeonensis]
MSDRRITRPLVVVGGVFSLIGAIVTVVYFFQPWRSCEYEDSSAGCSMLPVDAAVMMAAMVATVVGLVLLAVGLILGSRERSRFL